MAGALTPETALVLVRERGRAMAAAAAVSPTGMTAVLGGDAEVVLASIAAHGLTPANNNGAGQIVAAGTMDQLAAFAADPPAGARLRPLAVAGAFHTVHMAPAVDRLAELAASAPRGDTRHPPAVQRRRRRGHRGSTTLSIGSSARWPRRCAGTCACRPCVTSG